jgi:hypothetical protein
MNGPMRDPTPEECGAALEVLERVVAEHETHKLNTLVAPADAIIALARVRAYIGALAGRLDAATLVDPNASGLAAFRPILQRFVPELAGAAGDVLVRELEKMREETRREEAQRLAVDRMMVEVLSRALDYGDAQ